MKTRIALAITFLFGIASQALAANTTLPVTAGVGTNVTAQSYVSGDKAVGHLFCDPTTEYQCAAVSAGGAVKMDGSAVTQPVSGSITANIGTSGSLALDATLAKLNVGQGAALGTNTGPLTQGSVTTAAPTYTTGQISPLSLTVGGALRIDGSAATQPVSAASLPLPTGASTSAKQPALGTAGTASSDVLTVQGIASMTPMKVDGSAVTQPVSAGSLPLPTGAATAAKQPGIGTAGTPSADVISVQGVASGTVLPISAASLPLPTGAATSANQAINNADATGSAALTGAGTASVATNGAATVTVSAAGTGAGLTFSFQGQMPDASWQAVNAYPVPAVGQNPPVSSGSANGQWVIPGTAGFINVRVNLTAISSGTETFSLRASAGSSFPSTDSAIASGVPKSLISCDNYAKYDASTSGDTQIVALASGQKIYVCGYTIHVGGTATNVKLDYGTGANCVTGATAMTPAFQLLANAGRVVASPFWTGLATIASNELCVNASAANAIQVEVWYTQF